jgi:hypothetical protein
MMEAIALILAALAYGAFYAGAPGRQSQAVEPSGLYLWLGAGMTLTALALSIAATGTAVGPTFVLTVMMSVASVLAMVGPFVLPDARSRPRRTAPNPSAAQPATRPVNLSPRSDG